MKYGTGIVGQGKKYKLSERWRQVRFSTNSHNSVKFTHGPGEKRENVKEPCNRAIDLQTSS